MCKEINRKVFLILDNLSIHRSKKFISWGEKNADKIEIFYLTKYSPDVNTDERLNRDLKTHFYAGPIYKTKKEFINKLTALQSKFKTILNSL